MLKSELLLLNYCLQNKYTYTFTHPRVISDPIQFVQKMYEKTVILLSFVFVKLFIMN